MKTIKSIFILSTLLLFINCKPPIGKTKDTKNYTLNDIKSGKRSVKNGKLANNQLNMLKNYLINNYMTDLDSLEFVSIYYFNPKKNCSYDNYSFFNSNKSKSFFEGLESKMNTKLLVLHFEDEYSSNFSYLDVDKYLYLLMNKANQSCDFMFTINNKGVYYFRAGHLDVNMSNAFKNQIEQFHN